MLLIILLPFFSTDFVDSLAFCVLKLDLTCQKLLKDVGEKMTKESILGKYMVG